MGEPAFLDQTRRFEVTVDDFLISLTLGCGLASGWNRWQAESSESLS